MKSVKDMKAPSLKGSNTTAQGNALGGGTTEAR